MDIAYNPEGEEIIYANLVFQNVGLGETESILKGTAVEY